MNHAWPGTLSTILADWQLGGRRQRRLSDSALDEWADGRCHCQKSPPRLEQLSTEDAVVYHNRWVTRKEFPLTGAVLVMVEWFPLRCWGVFGASTESGEL